MCSRFGFEFGLDGSELFKLSIQHCGLMRHKLSDARQLAHAGVPSIIVALADVIDNRYLEWNVFRVLARFICLNGIASMAALVHTCPDRSR